MADREKVIANLTRCQDCLCDECELEHASHYPLDCEVKDQLINDALELLKEQEPLVIRKEIAYEILDDYIAACPECGMVWSMWYPEKMRFCPGCGKAVKWDE